MNYYPDYVESRLRELESRQRFTCPKCGAYHFHIEQGPDYRFSNVGTDNLVKCLSCGHLYSVPDNCTG